MDQFEFKQELKAQDQDQIPATFPTASRFMEINGPE